jgi:hypothetical protein
MSGSLRRPPCTEHRTLGIRAHSSIASCNQYPKESDSEPHQECGAVVDEHCCRDYKHNENPPAVMVDVVGDEQQEPSQGDCHQALQDISVRKPALHSELNRARYQPEQSQSKQRSRVQINSRWSHILGVRHSRLPRTAY